MISDEIGMYLQNATLDGKKAILLNGDDRYKVPLPKVVDVENISNAVLGGCHKYNLDYVSEDNVRKWAIAIREQYFLRSQPAKPKKEEAPIELTDDLKKEMGFDELTGILSTTIKNDVPSKLIAFCAMLLSQTTDDQFNIGFQAESSTGKSYIPLELAAYFPKERTEIIAGATPTAFFYEYGEWDDEKKVRTINKEGKIMVFTDMPDYRLMAKLRSFLSHDEKELTFKSTNKIKGAGNRAETVILRGYASVIFCTANINPDEQEKTRLMLLSPETDEEKIDEALALLVLKKGDRQKFTDAILNTKERQWLKDRIRAIYASGIRDVIIEDAEATVLRKFKEDRKHRIARHMRDLPRIMALIKAHALFNCFTRTGKTATAILATEDDIQAGFRLYSCIESSNELGLSPYLYSIYINVMQPLLSEGQAATTKEILKKFYDVRHKYLNRDGLEEILRQLETSGFIEREQDPNDRRKILVFAANADGKHTYPQESLFKANASSGDDSVFWNAVKTLLEAGEFFKETDAYMLLEEKGWDELKVHKAIGQASKKGLLMEKHGEGKYSKA